MPSNPNNLKSLQEAIVERLKDDGGLAGVEVIEENRHDLVTEIETALAKLGLCLIVQEVSAGTSHPNLPGPVLDSIAFAVEVWENPLLNRTATGTGTPAYAAAVMVAKCLHHFRPIGVEVFGSMLIRVANNTIENVPHPDLVGKNVNFKIGNE